MQQSTRKKKHVLQEELLKILISNTKKNPFVLAHKLSTLRGVAEDDPLLEDASSKTKTLTYVTPLDLPALPLHPDFLKRVMNIHLA